MEKRALLAVFLSCLVLLLWSLYSIQKVPQEPTPPSRRPQTEIVKEKEVRIQRKDRPEGKEKGAGKDIIVETDLYRMVLTTKGASIRSFVLKKHPESRAALAPSLTNLLFSQPCPLISGFVANNRELAKARVEGAKEKLEALERQRAKGAQIMLKIIEKEAELGALEGELKKLEEGLEQGYQTEARRLEIEGLRETIEKLRGKANQIRELQGKLEEARRSQEREKVKALENEMAVSRGVQLISFESTYYQDYPVTIELPGEGGEQLSWSLFKADKEGPILVEGEEREAAGFTYKAPEGWELTKVFTFFGDSYQIAIDVILKGAVREQGESLLIGYGPGIGLPELSTGRRYGYRGPLIQIKEEAKPRKERYSRDEMRRRTLREHQGEIQWVGLQSKYFLAALVPEGEARAAWVEKGKNGEERIGLRMPFRGEGRYGFRLYLGPKEGEKLKRLGVGLEKVIDYGFWAPVAEFLYSLLRLFQGWVHNYGLSIALLSLVIKLAFYPFTHKSFESMRKMQEDMKRLEPELKELRERYKNNSQKLNKATMELYKKRGVNPLSGCKGCLPLFFQMPVFFALYAVLYNSIELRQAHFFGWVTDLSSPDPYKVLPILMGATMYLQQKLTGMGTSTSAQPEQAKMMSIMMPIFLTFIFFNLASGIVLYWLCFNVFTILQQSLAKKRTAP